MTSVSIGNPAMAGIRKGMDDLHRAASKIASAEQSTQAHPDDLATALTDLKQAQFQVAVSAKALKAIDESIGYLIDDFA